MNPLPLLDLSVLTTSGNPMALDRSRKAAELHEALTLTGFVLLTNHGISKENITSMYSSAIEFFGSPDSFKEQFQKPKDRVAYHGYNFASDSGGHKYREYFHWWPNNPESNMVVNPSSDGQLASPPKNPSPSRVLDSFIYSNQALISECNLLCHTILSLLATGLGLPDSQELDAAHSGLENRRVPNHSYLASIFYPPVGPEFVMPRDKPRMGAHTDWDTFTLLFMDPIGGLEAKTVRGDWTPTDPIVDGDGNMSILLLVGDFLETWSGGIYRATEHRVLISTCENRFKKRWSIPYFVMPDNSVEIQPVAPVATRMNQSGGDNNGNDDKDTDGVNVGEYFERNALHVFNKSRET